MKAALMKGLNSTLTRKNNPNISADEAHESLRPERREALPKPEA